ncbi:GNAT family N-acetyltransferase [Pseudalkalibacillus decolorationis]|uniref:GNAT family N-acetyltransferase n=1 Tax=Pseudalkalibacillus decolorationis TaxID=163879 RepID=UPI0021472C4F|nr:GNAT family N-acetyltransferase [Pseudalkalibacillus decolorationis]
MDNKRCKETKDTTLTTFDENDIPGLIALSQLVGWDYDEREIHTVLSSGKIFGHKNNDGKIVSSGAIIPYDTFLASIGMVIVDPAYRGKGLGRDVTQTCIDAVPDEMAIMLIATNEGIPLYESMGFSEVDCIHKFLCEKHRTSKPLAATADFKIEPLRTGDLDEISHLDKQAYGDIRKQFLLNRIDQAKDCIVLKDRRGKVIGYGLSILGPVNLILGPIVAPSNDAASILLYELSRNHNGKLRIDVPSGHDLFLKFIQGCGFEKVNQPPIMILNADKMPERNQTYYGIAAQVFG